MPILLFTDVLVVLVGVLDMGQREDALDSLRAEMIPERGQQTDCGVPLDPRNTSRFIDWFYTIEQYESEQVLQDSALGASCCDDNFVATCCCKCSLTRSVWGLSAYPIREKASARWCTRRRSCRASPQRRLLTRSRPIRPRQRPPR